MSDDLRQRIEDTLLGHRNALIDDALRYAGTVRELHIDGGHVTADLEVGFPVGHLAQSLIGELRAAVEALPEVERAEIRLHPVIGSYAAQQNVERLKSVRNIIAVSSAKGGVGKSTVAANLTLALAAEGASVGMLDADIYGPSQPRMLGAQGTPKTRPDKTFEPMRSHGVQSMSIGYLIDEEQPMVWRGPMVSQALQQMLNDTSWQDLDYLIIDMPPGTGDIQLTLSQRVPLAGAIIVTTPQDIATLDARKGLQMFNKVSVPVLGIVENMSMHVCSNCGHEEHIFGAGGGERVASDYGVPMLGALPLDIRIREHADSGRPTVIADPEGETAQSYRSIALRMTARLSALTTEAGSQFPEIAVEED